VNVAYSFLKKKKINNVAITIVKMFDLGVFGRMIAVGF
jgi:hypothetical protein